MSPAAQCVFGTSRMTTRTLAFGAAMLSHTASVTAVINARRYDPKRMSIGGQ